MRPPDTALSGEYLPATAAAEQELVLLHGWGSDRGIWRPLLPLLRPWANITLLDLPGCAPGTDGGAAPQLEQVLAAVLAGAPARAVYVGWSLGGQLALELAAREPDRVAAVAIVCSNPRFLSGGGWPGMNPAEFARFSAALEADPGAALGRFDALQVTGAAQPRPLLRQLRSLRRGRPGRQLAAGLAWLESLDQRALLPTLAQPQLHLLAGCDSLVPPSMARSLEALLADAPRAAVELLPGCSHVLPLEASGPLAASLRRFLQRETLLHPAPAATGAPAKRDVAASFSRAARAYDSVATLQRDVGSRLLTNLDQLTVSPATVLDLGCGTGYFYPELRRRFPGARYIGLDLAQGMVEYAREHYPDAGEWLVGDAEALPLAADSVDLVFSSLALQWCFRPAHLFAELARVLRPGGRCVFTSLGPHTLCELRAAWAAVDDRQHVNDFLPPESLASAAGAVPGLRLGLGQESFRMEYQRVRDLLAELKTLGAHNMNRSRPTGLTSRRALQGMLEAYETWRENGVLPATYDVLFGVLEKR